MVRFHSSWEEHSEQDVGIHVCRQNQAHQVTRLITHWESQLFRAGIPEEVVQDRSGHCSLEGLRK